MLKTYRGKWKLGHSGFPHRLFARNQGSGVVRGTSVCILGGGPVGLLLSSQLSSYGIKHCIVERRLTPTQHPQAHFMNARTMEILQAHLPIAFKSVLQEMPSSDNWRDFVYCYSVVGRQFARVDHFKETSPLFWDMTPSNVVHLPQNKFEVILRKEVFDNSTTSADLLFGYDAQSLTFSPSGTVVKLKKSTWEKSESDMSTKADEILLKCDYLVAADGANSLARRTLNIPLVGEDSMHTLMNIHFTCRGLLSRLQPRPAMLYFAFNEGLVSVFVAHDPVKDEWVCQIPIFPPFRNPEDFDDATVQRLLKKGLGLSPSKGGSTPNEPDIKVLSVNSWTMHAQVADSFTNSHENVFLAGDAAHRFPPAGGFGMNTGLQDAHNIAWKLAMVISGKADKSLLSTYQSERKPVAESNTTLSMQNYEKSASVARMLGVDPALAKIAINTAKSSFSSLMPLSMRKVVINSILDMGLSTLALLAKTGYVLGDVRVKLVQRLVESKGSLPLIFPKEDIDFDYSTVISPSTNVSSSDHKTKVKSDNQVTSSSLVDRMFGSGGRTDKEVTLPILRQGGRIPHCWFFSPLSSSSSNGKISSHMADVTCNGTTPIKLEDRMSGLGNDQSIFSSVSLSAFNHASQMASTAYKGNPQSAFSSPKILLLVDQSHFDLWKVAVADMELDQFKVVAVASGISLSNTPDSFNNGKYLYNHEEMQKVIQNPHYKIDDSYETNVSPTHDVNRITEILSCRHQQEIHKGGEVVYDFTGRWMEICSDSNLSQHHLGENKSSPLQGFCSVALRPDGHVAGIFDFKNSSSLMEVKQHIQKVKISLHML